MYIYIYIYTKERVEYIFTYQLIFIKTNIMQFSNTTCNLIFQITVSLRVSFIPVNKPYISQKKL